jgi:hypothetical protein
VLKTKIFYENGKEPTKKVIEIITLKNIIEEIIYLEN